jgi:epoxyqueuosine reductase
LEVAFKHTAIIKKAAKELGFASCGISKSKFLATEAPKLEKWLTENKHGEMNYMANHFDKRLNPALLVDGAQSVVSLLYNYYPSETINGELKVSKYAYGIDYHTVVKDRLKQLLQNFENLIGQPVNGRCFVDSAPVLERAWAKESGLGFIGKNSMLINKTMGSFFFLAELIIDTQLIADEPLGKDYCGTCTKCIDACPTDAIVSPKVVDGSKCISYFTIELKGEIPQTQSKWNNWIFGCDICQDVCPWNRFSKSNQEPSFNLFDALKNTNLSDMKDISEEIFNTNFKSSALSRAKWHGIQRNIKFVQKVKD